MYFDLKEADENQYHTQPLKVFFCQSTSYISYGVSLLSSIFLFLPLVLLLFEVYVAQSENVMKLISKELSNIYLKT